MIYSKILAQFLAALLCLLTQGNFAQSGQSAAGRFNIDKDLLLAQFDCKTDVDDLHSVAAFMTLLSHRDFSKVNFHAVAGTYGTQEGLYVPANELFELAFGSRWSDAHKDTEAALKEVTAIVKKTISAGGDIWIAEAGQSDFSALLIKSLQKDFRPKELYERVHVVQHSKWNEEVTSKESLLFVKQNANYHKIPDGNATGNGTPGFRTPEYLNWKEKIANQHLLKIWDLAVDLGNRYNGKEDRYNNEAIAKGGVDFSDLSETCWILGLEDIRDSAQFFELYGN